MFTLAKPTNDMIRQFLNEQCKRDFTYPQSSGASQIPHGYVVDHHRVVLGEGQQAFNAAVDALKRWRQFQLGWVEAWPSDTAIREGEVVAVVAHVFGVWCVNACRIVRTIDEAQLVRRFGFAYGTLPGHVESGEEQFLVELDPAMGQVSYDILAFSKPRHVLAKLGYPIVRRLQKRFALDSMAVMKASV